MRKGFREKENAFQILWLPIAKWASINNTIAAAADPNFTGEVEQPSLTPMPTLGQIPMPPIETGAQCA
jgi:hypothetical protein